MKLWLKLRLAQLGALIARGSADLTHDFTLHAHEGPAGFLGRLKDSSVT